MTGGVLSQQLVSATELIEPTRESRAFVMSRGWLAGELGRPPWSAISTPM